MKVTIITPTYNHEQFIGKCIESVLSQTYKNWEQIIVDDGSTDGTENIVKEYSKKDKRIIYIKKEHEGIMNLKNAYNLALEKSSGDLIAILEGDDYWPDYKLEVQVPYFKEDNVVLTWGKALEVDREGKLILEIPPEYFTKLNNKNYKKELFYGNYIPASTMIIKKEILLEIKGFKQYNKLYCVDHPTLLALIPYGEFKFISDRALGYWVKHGNNVTISNYYNVLPIYKAAYHYYKKLPHSIRKEFSRYDFIMWLELNKRLIKQISKMFLRKNFPFLIRFKRLIIPEKNIKKKYYYPNNFLDSIMNEKN